MLSLHPLQPASLFFFIHVYKLMGHLSVSILIEDTNVSAKQDKDHSMIITYICLVDERHRLRPN